MTTIGESFWCHSCRRELANLTADSEGTCKCVFCSSPCEMIEDGDQIREFQVYRAPPDRTRKKLELKFYVWSLNPLRITYEVNERRRKVAYSEEEVEKLASVPVKEVQPNDLDGGCTICCEEFGADEALTKLACGHCFHKNCIGKWLLEENSCPLCRQLLE
eukprot:TRINITY_DN12188_c0_g1_i3.p1 TRINITY_DN12188_c0_g1~~TRINITY_DN12188_c0_g1_i3.p1  ORF type:complete len:161 (-),score=29.28 TRINITY_DN12188_c0_g1_i3:89-571(-)